MKQVLSDHKPFLKTILSGFVFILPNFVFAADIDGSQLSLFYTLPFVALLLAIALMPLLVPGFWHKNYGSVAMVLAACFLVPFAIQWGIGTAASAFAHALLAEYIPFVILLSALFCVSGGIYIKGDLRGSPKLNTGILALGGMLASIMGTTGAAMLLIRPLISANSERKHNTHIFVFFIFIVANIGGSLTPLGDPPLFLGFLKGVNFFWTAQYIWLETLILVVGLLMLFYFIETYWYKKEGIKPLTTSSDKKVRFAVEGWKLNAPLLLSVMGLVLMSGFWKAGEAFSLLGTPVLWPQLIRDVGLVIVILISLLFTSATVRYSNQFNWEPMKEVAKLFAGIFLTIIPVLAMLKAGLNGPFAPIIASVTDSNGQPIPIMYFWATGLLSGFLDNAPTYLVFFNLAGGDAGILMTTLAPTLAAISAGAVFMGALSYIGNAPNLMVKAIVENRGIRMPSFFGYVGWSFLILLPLLILITFVFTYVWSM
jgi:Na+/H+ antiporter NhaD/arsenite permease-like protein